MLQLVLLLLLHHHLVLVQLFDGVRVNVLVHVGGRAYWRLLVPLALDLLVRLFFDPKVLRGFEVVSKDRNNFLDLRIRVRVHEEVGVQLRQGIFAFDPKFNLHLTPSRHLLLGLRQPGIFIPRIKQLNPLSELVTLVKNERRVEWVREEASFVAKHKLFKCQVSL